MAHTRIPALGLASAVARQYPLASQGAARDLLVNWLPGAAQAAPPPWLLRI